MALIDLLSAIDGVAQFRIIDDSFEHTRVLIVPSRGLGAEVFGEIDARLRRRLEQDVWFEIVVCDTIPIEAFGKFRDVVDRVASNC